MTDRRRVSAVGKSWSPLSLIAMGDDGSCGLNKPISAATRNNNRCMGLSSGIKRIHVIICLLAAVSTLHLIFKRPSIKISAEGKVREEKHNLTESITLDDSIITTIVQESEPSPSRSPFSTKKKPTESETAQTTKETQNPKPTSITPGVDNPESTSVEVVISGDVNNEMEDKSQNESKIRTETSVSSSTILEEKSHDEFKNETKTSVSSTTIIELGKVHQIEEIPNIGEDKNISNYDKNGTDEKLNKEPINETQTDGITSIIPSPSSLSSSPPKTNHTSEETAKKSSDTTTIDKSNQLPKPLSDSNLSPIAQNFAEVHCDLTHLKDKAWYPSGPEDDWQRRAPYLIVAGVWNAGVNQLATALLKHPQIIAAKTDGFFLPKQFSRYFGIQTNGKNAITNNQTAAASTGKEFNVKVFAARERMYAQVYSKAMLRDKVGSNDEESAPTTTITGDTDENNGTKNQHVAMDVSPGLIFYAHKTAHSILCTVPWVKIVVVLRNPIDRLYRQWSFSVTHLNLKLSLEQWMAQEMKVLQSVEIIDGSDEVVKEKPVAEDQPEMVISEKEAWDQYQSVRNIAGGIGRSLYVFQLEEWLQAYISAGKTPSEEIIILTTEDIAENPEHEYAELIQFVGLAPLNNKNGDDGTDSVAAALGKTLAQSQKSDTEPMSEETRKMLRKFFKPYNERLTKLLTSNGFKGDWSKRWE